MEPKTLDHVAFWLADREPIAEFVTTRLGLHVIDRQDNFTLVGADARRGKLTLFDAEGPRDPGAFKHVALRVSKLPEGETEFELGEGVKLILVETPTDSEYDLDHVALFSADPAATAEAYERFGFDAAEPAAEGHPRVQVGGAYIEFHPGQPGDPARGVRVGPGARSHRVRRAQAGIRADLRIAGAGMAGLCAAAHARGLG